MSIEHEFSDVDILLVRMERGTIDVFVEVSELEKMNEPHIQFDRDDIIAMAKSIELTGEDLK